LRVLLDEQLRLALAADLVGHEASTVKDQRWQGLTNGALLERAGDAGFDVLLTADRNLEFQQNLARARVGIVLLEALSNKVEDLRPLLPRALEALESIRPGEIIRVGT